MMNGQGKPILLLSFFFFPPLRVRQRQKASEREEGSEGEERRGTKKKKNSLPHTGFSVVSLSICLASLRAPVGPDGLYFSYTQSVIFCCAQPRKIPLRPN